MTAIVIVGVLILILLGIGWSRVAAARADRRSMDTYEHVLGVLGHVSQRSETVANINAPSADNLARPHVRTAEQLHSIRPSAGQTKPIAPPRVRLTPPTPVRPNALPLFGRDDLPVVSPDEMIEPDELVGATTSQMIEQDSTYQDDEETAYAFNALDDAAVADTGSTYESDSPVSESVSPATRHRTRRPTSTQRKPHGWGDQHARRRALTGAAAAVGIGAIAVGSWHLVGSQPGRPGNSATQGSHAKGSSSHHSTSPDNGSSGALEPISSSNGLIAYQTATSSFTIAFSATDECWIGVEQSSSSNGPWLAMKTIDPAGTWSYAANGSVTVRIGAPKSLSITINGEPVDLPSGDQPYNVSFSPATSTSA